MELSTPAAAIPGIGPAYKRKLEGMGIATIRDLLLYFPRSYEDFSLVVPISQLQERAGSCSQGTILEVQEERTFKKHLHITTAIVQDASGSIRVVWFNQPYLPATLKKGLSITLAGTVTRDKRGLYISNPAYEIGDDHLHTGRIVPVYQETAGVTSRWLRGMIWKIMQIVSLRDALPPALAKERNLLPYQEALREIHFPSSFEHMKQARKRFAFEELFFISLFVLTERKKLARVKAHGIKLDESLMARFTASLPFRLTGAQRKAAWKILKDMEKPRPMNRLLQGDVGSGKTVIACMAALEAARAGLQSVFMAPTELLAKQHFATAGALLGKFKLQIGLLTGSTDLFISPKLPQEPIEISRKKLLDRTLKGEIHVLVGTQALIQDKVKFENLALVILDEQHRFGVNQRAKLLKKKTLIPHLLSMTATPIPRTLAMSIYGDLDLALLDEMPPGRKEIETRLIPPDGRKKAYQFLRQQIEKGRQVFVVCPRIEADEMGEVKTVKQEYEKFSKELFPDLNVAMLHGKMPKQEKEEVMRKFRRGKIDILISTSVIEVGIDIPNASVMVVEGAERFGLAQLHQFRGRVGRGSHQSFCLLFSESSSPTTQRRLRALQEAKNGFELAEKDLQIRGPGDFAGVKQWGVPDFAMQHLTDAALVQEARQAAESLLTQDVALASYPELRSRLDHLREKLHLE